MLNIGRLFLALRECLKELDTFYRGIGDRKTSILCPSIRTYENIQFEYIARLDTHHLSKAIFKARTQNGELIVVKFTNSYSAGGHRLLEAAALAPKLRYFSGNQEAFKKPRGLEMVVMDFIIENSDSSLTPRRLGDVKKAMDIFHNAGYVFGDLRGPNILRLKDGHAMLVDIDWCGMAGEAMGLNTGVGWPPGSGIGEPVVKAHDGFMFNQIVEVDHIIYQISVQYNGYSMTCILPCKLISIYSMFALVIL